MDERKQAVDELKRVFEGDAWHGPSLQHILKGVSAAQATQRVVPGAHTIWELVAHVAAWDGAVCRWLEGEAVGSPPEDFPTRAAATEEDWRRLQAELQRNQRRLRTAMQRFSPRRLAARVPTKRYSYRRILLGMVEHNVYHAGQIALLKKGLR